MTKQEFLLELKKALNGLSQNEINERLNFYSEMIDDRIEEGISEEDAVSAVGDAEEIAEQIILETPLLKLAKERIKPQRRLTALEIVLLILGFPIWLSVGISIFAVILSLYICVWTVVFSLWAVFVSLVASGFGVILAGIVFSLNENILSGIASIGTGIACLGISIFAFFACKAATKGVLILTKKIALFTKNCFIKKGDAK